MEIYLKRGANLAQKANLSLALVVGNGPRYSLLMVGYLFQPAASAVHARSWHAVGAGKACLNQAVVAG